MNISIYSNIIRICYLTMPLIVSFSIYSGHHSILIAPSEVETNPAVWLTAVSNYKGKNSTGHCIWWSAVLQHYLRFLNKFVCDWYVSLLYVCSAGHFLFIWSNGIVHERPRHFNCYAKGKLSHKPPPHQVNKILFTLFNSHILKISKFLHPCK